ncbi:MAG: serine hydrolase domain-containing protein [Phycisphaerales bacterium JB063]
MLTRVRELIERGMADGLHIGGQVCVWRGEECVADFGVGVVDALAGSGPEPSTSRDREGADPRRGTDESQGPLPDGRGSSAGNPIRPDSIALWMSSGKPVTAVAIAQLVEQGEVELDDPVAAFIPAFAAHGKEDITVRHLLTHTAGLRTADFRYPRDDWDTIIAAVCDRELEDGWVTGEKAGYHTQTTWFILGELVRLVDGRPIDQYVREMIFEPLQMRDSWMGMPTEVYDAYAEQGRLMMMPNTAAAGPGSKPSKSAVMSRDWSTRPRPGGNCMGPIRELARFYRMLLGGGELDGVCILRPETVELFTSRQRKGMFDQTFKATVDWGLGFVLNSAEHAPLGAGGRRDLAKIPYGYGPFASRETFGHSGAQSSVGFADPGNGLAVGIVLNGTPGEAKHQRRMLPILTALYEDLGLAQT